MNKGGWGLPIVMIILASILTGCLEQTATNTGSTFENIEMSSDIVKLVYAKFNKTEIRGNVVRVNVEYRLKNLLNRTVHLIVFVQFYNRDGKLLAISDTKSIDLLPNYEEKIANVASYDGEFAPDIEYARIIVEERD